MKSKSAEKVRLTSFDDLFGTGEAAAGETVTSVPLSQLHTTKTIHSVCWMMKRCRKQWKV